MGVYAIYVILMLTTMSVNEEVEEKEEDNDEDNDNDDDSSFLKNLLTLNLEPIFVKNKITTGSAWAMLLTTMGIIGGACALLVYSCENLAIGMGIQTYFVAVIIASAATSVPDTILSYRDAMAGEYDDAVANALGSNIFDICFALGFPLFVFTMMYGSIQLSPETVENITELRGLLLVLTIVAFFIYYFGDNMGRIKAVLLLLIYVGFTAFILAKAYEMQWALNFGDLLRGWMSVIF
jgi:cation:H+ antiporter